MAIIKTAALSGVGLDYAVAVAMNKEVDYSIFPRNNTGEFLVRSDDVQFKNMQEQYRPFTAGYSPSTNWSQGGPIVDEAKIAWEPAGEGWAALMNDCFCNQTYEKASQGETQLIAAMRCFVAAKLGDEVDIPDRLIVAPAMA